MEITIIDEERSYDGMTPLLRPLGWAEKAVVGLSEALAARGHEVVVINRTEETSFVNGVNWLPWESPRPPFQQVVIALRKPGLVQEIDAQKSLLWMSGGSNALVKPINKRILEEHRPTLIYVSEMQRRRRKPWTGIQEEIIEPGISSTYLEREINAEVQKPVAITTTHPSHGLRDILRMWTEGIRPVCSKAELHVYSSTLSKAMGARGPDTNFAAVYEDILHAKPYGVCVKSPLSDPEMASVYRQAKVHLYPVIGSENYCGTLAESQASGLPAVVNAIDGNAGAAGVRVRNGQTGYLAPDESAFINLTNAILSDDSDIYRTLHRDCLNLQRNRSWQNAAIEFEAIWE